jgi:hypothetical protein
MRAAELMDQARSKIGLDEFGSDSFVPGLEVLCAAIEKEARLNAVGERAVWRQLRQLLINRLEIEECYRLHPEIEEQRIVSPWFGLGLPRTGSSALNNLLAMDPGRRYLRTWEAERPCPPPHPEIRDDDPRIEQVALGIELLHRIAPEFKVIHQTTATGPNEDGVILSHEFKSAALEALVRVPSYSEWRASCDMTSAYRFHERFLKLLQWRCPPRVWQLKSPVHLHSFEALLDVYPDARFVMTHRDPAKVLPSACSMWRVTMSLYSDDVDSSELGRVLPEFWAQSLRRLVAWREENDDTAFCDIAYRDITDDPIPAISNMYAAFGEELAADAEQPMRSFLRSNPKDKHGVHRYSLEDYGIDPDELRRQYAFYNERFAIPSEADIPLRSLSTGSEDSEE